MKLENIKRIVFVMPFHILDYKGGGAEVQAHLWAEELSRRGYDVYYICKLQNKIDKKVNYNINQIKSEDVDEEIYSILEKNKPDLIIQRNSDNILFSPVKYSKRNNIFFTWILSDDLSSSKYLYLIRSFQSIRLMNIIKIIGFLFFLPFNLIRDFRRRKIIRKVEYGFVLNNRQKENLKNNYKKKSFIIKSGYSEAFISKKNIKNRRIILWAGNFGKNKQPEKFIKITKKMKNFDKIFYMLGNNKLNYKDTTNLKFIGRIPFMKTSEFFSTSFLFINTSVHEGFPNTFLQSWFNKVPVITLGVDPDGIITKHKLGFVCKSINEVIEKIKNLVEDKNEYNEISHNCYNYAIDNHRISDVVDDYIETLTKI